MLKWTNKKIHTLFFFRIENSLYKENIYTQLFYVNFFLSIKWLKNLLNLKYSSLINKTNIPLIFNNLLFNQKSFKHLWSLPVNGQRTWSNKKTSKKKNIFLINYKIKQITSNISGGVNLINLKNLIFINYLNWIWKLFWKKDWIFLYKKNKKLLNKYTNSKKRPLTFNKLLNFKPDRKKSKKKNQTDLRHFFNYIGLDNLIKLPK